MKFRLKVRKFKCNDCDTITLLEHKHELNGLFSCPNCSEPMEHMEDITVVQEDIITLKDNEIFDLQEENKQIKEAYKDRESDIKSYVKALEEIKETYIYGLPNHEGEVMVECENTCDAMYQIAVNITTLTDA